MSSFEEGNERIRILDHYRSDQDRTSKVNQIVRIVRQIISRSGIPRRSVRPVRSKEPNPVVLPKCSSLDRHNTCSFSILNLDLEIMRYILAKLRAEGKAWTENRQPLKLILADGSVSCQRQLYQFCQPIGWPTTGTMMIQASFKSWPGATSGFVAKVGI